jgi:hypothetical protein
MSENKLTTVVNREIVFFIVALLESLMLGTDPHRVPAVAYSAERRGIGRIIVIS